MSRSHKWVIATTIDVSPDVARTAHEREVVVLSSVRCDVLDLYCDHCRRQYEALAEEARRQAAGDPDLELKLLGSCALGPQHSGGPRRQPELEPVPPALPSPPAGASPPGELSLFD